MSIQLTELRESNIRELTKKEKIFGLNFMSWISSLMAGFSTNGFLGIYSLYIFLVMIITFYIAEFFDDDIMDILLASFTLKTSSSKYFA